LGTFQQNTFIAFCNAADTKDRNNLTLKISKDEGKSWYKSFLIDKNPTSETKDFTAYSDIVKINNYKIGVLYERNNYQEIVFTTVKWR
jgi:sialidase-1